jgi:tetratricopeptide (TPR) repeat protein
MSTSSIDLYAKRGSELLALGDQQTAGKLFLRAYKNMNSEHLDDSYVIVYWNMAIFYCRQKRWAKAEAILSKAILFCEHKQCRPDLVPDLVHQLADVYNAKGKPRLAARTYERAITLYEQQNDPLRAHRLSKAHDTLAEVYCTSDRFCRAELWARHAIAYFDRENSAPHSLLVRQLSRLAWVLSEAAHYDRAEHLYRQILSLPASRQRAPQRR